VPAIVARDRAIRVWSAGCASGEEAFTLAMVFAETLGEEKFRQRVKIYATDADEKALASARQGEYSAKELEPVPEPYRERYFEPAGPRYLFRPDLRRTVIFGRHDLTADAPISRLDLLVCRNTLIYLNAETQERVLARFHFALNPDGYLFLGRAEMLLAHANVFEPVNIKARIFSKAAQPEPPAVFYAPLALSPPPPGLAARAIRLRDQAFEVAPVAQVVVDLDGGLVAANNQARAMFGINSRDIGRPLQDLEISYRPLELPSRIEQAHSEGRVVHVRNVERSFPDGQSQYLDVALTPLPIGGENGPSGISVTFADITRYNTLQHELARSSEELETAYEELQAFNEELEASNEELQSTVEELETTNEELQSASEELETMNEELQATNYELEAMNEELRTRTGGLDVSNAFLTSILASTSAAVIVLDQHSVVQLWNEAAEDLWGLRAEETRGQPLFGLDFGLPPLEELRDAVRVCTDGGSTREILEAEAVDRRGRQIRCRLTCTPLMGNHRIRGAVLLIEESTSRR
jgi:two-component system CheB/CheR fusion protein